MISRRDQTGLFRLSGTCSFHVNFIEPVRFRYLSTLLPKAGVLLSKEKACVSTNNFITVQDRAFKEDSKLNIVKLDQQTVMQSIYFEFPPVIVQLQA